MIRALLLLILLVLMGGALLTPLAYELLRFIYQEVPWPFARVFDRVAMLVAFVTIVILRKDFGLLPVKRFLKSGKPLIRLRSFFIGIILSLACVAIFLPSAIEQTGWTWQARPLTDIPLKILKVSLAACVIALIEEGFFRVLLLRRALLGLPSTLAVGLVSLIYAFVHFITPDKSYVYPGWSLSVGVEYLVLIGERIFLPEVMMALIGLFCVGLVLGFAMIRTGSLYLCMGLHAGWVFALKMISYFTTSGAGFDWPAGMMRGYALVANPFGWVSILSVLLVILALSSIIKWEEKSELFND
ncbi:MAG: CPBP family intramembrane metalloprotease [Bdellovibrionales bacterium]|nr:CPBP family intramembrane metalloprotease [Bdellovibrionales bacterium]